MFLRGYAPHADYYQRGSEVTTDESGDPPIGNADNFEFAIQGIRIGDGDMLPIPGRGSVTVIVGANNVGKSTALVQIQQILRSQSLQWTGTPRVVTEIESPWGGSPDDMMAWLRANGRDKQVDNRPHINRAREAHAVDHVENVRRHFPTPYNTAGWFVNSQRPSERVEVCNSTGQVATIGDPPTHPLHVLQIDEAARDRLNGLAERIFGIKLYLDTLGANLLYRLGDPGLPPPAINAVTAKYAHAVAQLPRLDLQGDGLRSTLGLLMPLITDQMPLTLIDEPEAFLHPPQARIVGSEIGKLVVENNSQVILSTHDKNLLQGLAESGAPVSIIHLGRTDDIASAKLLDVDSVAALWQDVTLRYGDALDGLFHAAVVLTEGDRDSHFYAAAVDAEQGKSSSQPQAHNIMFLSSNGKQNMAQYITRLSALGVLAISSPDLDIINDPSKLRILVEAHGGDWALLEPDYKKATAEFLGAPKPPKVDQVQTEITALFAGHPDEDLTERLANDIADVVKLPKTGWRELKKYGFSAFKADKAAATRLLDALDSLGIVTLRVGELENFLTTASASKGAGWLPVAFGQKAHQSAAAGEHSRRLLRAAGVT